MRLYRAHCGLDVARLNHKKRVFFLSLPFEQSPKKFPLLLPIAVSLVFVTSLLLALPTSASQEAASDSGATVFNTKYGLGKMLV